MVTHTWWAPHGYPHPSEEKRFEARRRAERCREWQPKFECAGYTGTLLGFAAGLGDTMGSGSNMVTTVIGFGLSATFIAEYHGNDPEPSIIAAIPNLNLKFSTKKASVPLKVHS
ncbi:hypothetical protein Fmac_011823 [Flemingia macrophylla]|uniref:Uncharacterized protein n=1 Tax=Flemingia macrophylla TaxID=520843 RepID=A0ABD1MNK4_9FABA